VIVEPFYNDGSSRSIRIGRLIVFNYKGDEMKYVTYDVRKYPLIVCDIMDARKEFHVMWRSGGDWVPVERDVVHRLLKEWRQKEIMKKVFR